MENEIERPAKIPLNVLMDLRKDNEVRRCATDENLAGNVPAAWFKASVVHLSNSRNPDLIVQPNQVCLFGANIGPFWVFRNIPKGYKLAL